VTKLEIRQDFCPVWGAVALTNGILLETQRIQKPMKKQPLFVGPEKYPDTWHN
jgi:hypothetical protein